MVNSPTTGIRFSPEELEMLDAVAAKEERSRSDIIRRAVRAYAEQAGVKLKPAKKAAAKR